MKDCKYHIHAIISLWFFAVGMEAVCNCSNLFSPLNIFEPRSGLKLKAGGEES